MSRRIAAFFVLFEAGGLLSLSLAGRRRRTCRFFFFNDRRSEFRYFVVLAIDHVLYRHRRGGGS